MDRKCRLSRISTLRSSLFDRRRLSAAWGRRTGPSLPPVPAVPSGRCSRVGGVASRNVKIFVVHWLTCAQPSPAMKTEPLDFMLAATLIAIIGIIAWAGTALIAVPVTRLLFHEYHVVIDSFILLLGFGLGCAVAVRILLRLWPLSSGEYSMSGRRFTEWKLIAVLTGFGQGALRPFTTEFARPLVARLFGAEIGGDTALGGELTDFPFISVASGCILGRKSVVTGHALTNGRLILRHVKIARGATVGVGAVIMPGAEIGANSIVAAGAIVPMGTKIPPGQLWAGIPAKLIKEIDETDIRG